MNDKLLVWSIGTGLEAVFYLMSEKLFGAVSS